MANSFGIPSPDPTVWAPDIRHALDVLRPGQILIVSVVGEYEEHTGQALVADFVDVACLAERAGARIIELNLSCPNTLGRDGSGVYPPICSSPEDTYKIVSAVRAALDPSTKLVAKLGYLPRAELESVVEPIAEAVDGVAGINTLQVPVTGDHGQPVFRGSLTDPDKPRLEAGVSGIAIRDLALDFVRCLALLRRKNDWHFDIIAMDAVQTATAASNNPELPRRLCGDGHPEPSEEDRLVALLNCALTDPRWDFRTIDGLATELRLATDRVRSLIQAHPGVARRSVMGDRGGRDLFTARGRPPTVRERLERLRWLLAR
jgi:dihydroorotate dehydrogenase